MNLVSARVGWLVTVAVLSGAAGAQTLPAASPASASASSPRSAAAIAALLANPDRSEADRRNDERRKPAELLGFIGVREGMVALDVFAGGGYTSELLARAVGPGGRVYGQSAPRRSEGAPLPRAPEGQGAEVRPAGPAAPPSAASTLAAASAGASTTLAPGPRTSATAIAERARRSGLANLVAVVQPYEAPVPGPLVAGALDLVTLLFNYHDLGYLGVDRAKMTAALFTALRPGGLYVVADHAGRPGTGIAESDILHRVEEAFVRREIEAAGFRLVQTGDFLRNPADPRDRNTPEPPMPKDEFVLKFVRP